MKRQDVKAVVVRKEGQEHVVAGADDFSVFEEYGLLAAINGDGFTRWWSPGPLDYYPHFGALFK